MPPDLFWCIVYGVVGAVLAGRIFYLRGLRAGKEKARVDHRDSMTFAEFTRGNQIRCVSTFKRDIVPDSAIAFALGVGEESGEVLGKVRAYLGITARKSVTVEDIGDEIADTVSYADLLAACYGMRLEDCLQRKYNAVSQRSGSKFRFVDGTVMSTTS